MPEQTINSQQGNIPPYPSPYYSPRKKRRWWIPVLIIAIIFFFILLPVFAVIGLVGSALEEEEVVLKKNSVLVVNLDRKLDEYSQSNPFEEIFGDKETSFNDVLFVIKRAKKDDRIKGIYLKSTPTSMGFAKSMELMDVMDDFKKSGKFIYSFIKMGGESGYFRTLPSNKIFMSEEGLVSLNGFGIEAMFLKGLFDKIGIEFYVEKFEDFKSAGETMNRRSFSDSARLEYREILNQRQKFFVDAVAKYRNLDKDFINAALNRGVYTADTLLAFGFVDSLMHETDFIDMLKDLTQSKKVKNDKKEKLRTISVADYLKADYNYDKRKFVKDKCIAVIYGVGAIVDGPANKFSDQKTITSKMAKYIKEAREDDQIKAIILRVDSPGGSVMASDDIWKEVVKTKGIKPIYASMSDVAASGGYYISMACDTIIAHPATITGSIGVIAALPNMSGTWKKLDITLDTISTTAAAHDLSLNYPFEKRQKEKLHSMIQKVYFRFVQKVADDRNMTFDEARALAKGRVWTGEAAKEKGLVDVLGGFGDAINLAKARIGIADNERIRVIEYPKKKNPVEALMEMFGNDDENVSITQSFKNALAGANSTYTEIYKSLPYSMKLQLDYARSMLTISRNEPFMYALPYYIVVE
jgi:protease-4